MLSEQAVMYPSINSSEEDLLITFLIAKTDLLLKKDSTKNELFNQSINSNNFNVKEIHQDANNLPFDAILMGRTIKKKEIPQLLQEWIKNNNHAKIKILAAQNPKGFKEALFFKNNEGNTPIHLAVFSGHIEIIKLMTQESSFPFTLFQKNKDGWTAIHIAAFEGHKEILKLIAEAAPTEFKKCILLKNNLMGFTVVSGAVNLGQLEVLKFIAKIAPTEFKKTLLLQNNVGNTPVHEAVFIGHLEILKLLAEIAPIEFKKVILLQSNTGHTPIHGAIYKNNMKALKLIEEYAPIESKQTQFLDIKKGEDSLHNLAIKYIEDTEMLKWLAQIFPETTCKVSNDGRSALDVIKMNRPHNYKEIIDLYKNSHHHKCNKERVKRLELSHGWDLSGDSWLIAYETREIFNKFTLESHSSPQWFHILGKDLDLFKQSYPKFLNDFEAKLFKEVFDISANSKCFSLENKLARIKKGLPIMINSGFAGHAVTLLIWDKQIVICNRGALSRDPLEIYHFSPENLDLNDLNELLKTGLYGTPLDYKKLYFEELPKKLLFKQTELDKELEIVSASLPYQIVRNCSFISPITAFYAMKLLMEVRKIEKGEKFYQTAILEKGEDEFFSLDSSYNEDSPSLSSKIIDQETLVKIKEEHKVWFETWLSFTKITFLERNIRPLENKPYFKPDDLLILKTLDKAHLLPLDDLCKKKLNELSKIFYNYFVTNS